MIETTIVVEALPGKRTELLQTLQSMAEEIRGFKGCKSCVFFQVVDNENIFTLVEEWDSQENLEAHFNSEIFGVFKGTKSLLIRPPEILIKAISYRTGIDL